MNAKDFGKLPRGSEEHFYDATSNVIVVRWNDNGIVNIASNQHGKLPLKLVERYCSKEKKRLHVKMPCVIGMYNQRMGGVDRLDENISSYRISIRGMKWYYPLIFYLINVCVNNAWLFARKGDYSGDLLAFTQSVVQHLCKNYGTPPSNPGKQKIKSSYTLASDSSRYDGSRHEIIVSEPIVRRKCRECSSQSRYKCKQCDVHFNIKCTPAYHTKKLGHLWLRNI